MGARYLIIHAEIIFLGLNFYKLARLQALLHASIGLNKTYMETNDHLSYILKDTH